VDRASPRRPGWSLLVRGSPTVRKVSHTRPLEGIIETDHWFGPAVSTISVSSRRHPIEFREDIPFLQVQPVRKDVYSENFCGILWSGTARAQSENWAQFTARLLTPNTAAARESAAVRRSVESGRPCERKDKRAGLPSCAYVARAVRDQESEEAGEQCRDDEGPPDAIVRSGFLEHEATRPYSEDAPIW